MKVAYFLSELDLIFASEVPDGFEIFAIVYSRSDQENSARGLLKMKNIISIKSKNENERQRELNEDLLKETDLAEQLKSHNIDCLLITNSSDYFEKWSKKNKIILLSPSDFMQKKFENKIFFENFMALNSLPKPAAMIVESALPKMPFRKTVLQIPTSWGNEGTFILNSQKAFDQTLAKLQYPLLAREYKKGLPLSSSILITGSGHIYLTSIERQCFYKNSPDTFGRFIGIQWLPYNFFSPVELKNIEKVLLKAAKSLYKGGLTGLINLDFIFDTNGEVHFIECNPRMACATNQIIGTPSLRNDIELFNIFLEHFSSVGKTDLGTGAEFASLLPRNLFKGCQMFVYFAESEKFPKKVTKFKSSDFYLFKNGNPEKIFLKKRFDFAKLKNGIFYYNRINKGEVYEKNLQIGIILSNFPLYNLRSGKLNKKGKAVYNYFHKY